MTSLIPSTLTIQKCIDLGVGEGSLLSSVKSLWPSSHCVGIDIDNKNIKHITQEKNFIKTYNLDSLKAETIIEIKASEGLFDLVIGNPPYKKIELNNDLRGLLYDFDLEVGKYQKYCSSDLIFLLQGLLLLKDDGYLIYIMPDGFLTNKNNERARKLLTLKYRVEQVVEIPEKSFSHTEAKTHILALTKRTPNDRITISSTKNGRIANVIINDFINRGDYSYHTKIHAKSNKKISDFNVDIIRGRHSKKYLELSGELFIHTDEIRKSKIIDIQHRHTGDGITTKKGDIVLARVGTRVIGLFSLIKNGEVAISDCVFIIRCYGEDVHRKVIRTINSEFGKNWLKSISKGVGAKHISKSELLKMPIL